MQKRFVGIAALASAGALWPSLVCAIQNAMMSPLDRVLQSAWCGSGPTGADTAYHCAVCYVGAGLFFAAALYLALPLIRQSLRRFEA